MTWMWLFSLATSPSRHTGYVFLTRVPAGRKGIGRACICWEIDTEETYNIEEEACWSSLENTGRLRVDYNSLPQAQRRAVDKERLLFCT